MWLIDKILYPTVEESRLYIKVEVNDESRPMVSKAMYADQNLLKKERKNIAQAVGDKVCYDRSECSQCGDCSRSKITVKKNRSDDPVHNLIEIRENRAITNSTAQVVAEQIEHQNFGEALQKHVNELSSKQKNVITLRYLEGLTTTETAERTGMSKSSVSHIENRALDKLRKMIA